MPRMVAWCQRSSAHTSRSGFRGKWPAGASNSLAMPSTWCFGRTKGPGRDWTKQLSCLTAKRLLADLLLPLGLSLRPARSDIAGLFLRSNVSQPVVMYCQRLVTREKAMIIRPRSLWVGSDDEAGGESISLLLCPVRVALA